MSFINPDFLELVDIQFELKIRNVTPPDDKEECLILLEQELEDGTLNVDVEVPFEEGSLRSMELVESIYKQLQILDSISGNTVDKVKLRIKSKFAHLLNRVKYMRPATVQQKRQLDSIVKEVKVCGQQIEDYFRDPPPDVDQLSRSFGFLTSTPKPTITTDSQQMVTVDQASTTPSFHFTPPTMQSSTLFPHETGRFSTNPFLNGALVESLPPEMGQASHNPFLSEAREVPTSNYTRVPPHKWNLSFSGGHKGLSVHQFLERVHELRVARNVSYAELFHCAIDLFQGPALSWLRSVKHTVTSWSELEEKLIATFLPPDYEDSLLEEIRARKQKENEPAILFISSIRGLYSQLPSKVPVKEQVRTIRRNLLPSLAQHLVLLEINDYDELERYCQRVAYNVSNLTTLKCSRPKREIQLAAIERSSNKVTGRTYASRQDFRPTATSRTNIRCWNCNTVGHTFLHCREPRSIFCFKCGAKGTTTLRCRRCSVTNTAYRTGEPRLALEAPRVNNPARVDTQGNEYASSQEGAAARPVESRPLRTFVNQGAIPKTK